LIEIANAIVSNPSAALTLLSVLIACGMGYALYSMWLKRTVEMNQRWEEAETRFTIRSASIETSLSDTRKDLALHREDMGKASKAIAGEMLKTKEKIFELKQEISSQVDEIRRFSAEVHRSMVLANETAKVAIENLNEKIGRVIVIEDKMATMESLITKLNVHSGENKTEIIKHRSWFEQVAKNLATQKDRLENLEKNLKGKP
jgi:chromosome segregation ATPase